MNIKKLTAVIFALVCLSVRFFAIDLKIQVMDRDLEIPLEGVLLSVTESGTQIFTDASGTAVMAIADGTDRVVLVAQLIGYEPRKILIRDFSKPVTIELLMEGILEGEELVVIEKAIGETDEEVGTSTVIEKEVIQSASKMGLIEDVMSSVAMLPGVSFGGMFNSYLSVRGGAPGEMTAVQDGFVVKYPYHWGGGFSIFNPNMVESVKFSPGVFTAKHGDAGSGLLEINTISPQAHSGYENLGDGLSWSVVSSLSTEEAFVEMPVGTKAGMFAGFRLTSYDLSFELSRSEMEKQGTTFSRIPYIYDAYFKTVYRPHDGFEWYVNAFAGNDGIGIEVTDEVLENTNGIVNDFDFKFYNTDAFVNTGVKIMAGERLLINLLGGYEYWLASIDGEMREFGTREYSDEFIDTFGASFGLSDGDTFTVDMESAFINDILNQGAQGRFDTDFAINDSLVWQNGTGAYYDLTTVENRGNYFFTDYSDGVPELVKASYDTKADETSVLKSFAYTNLSWKLLDEAMEVNAGARADHGYIWAKDFEVNTYPIASPRLSLRYTLPGEGGFLKKQTFSLGSGIFSKVPFDALGATKEMGLESFDITMPKSLMTVAGWETELPSNLRFRIEGYYKYLYDRFYYAARIDDATGNQELIIKNDGIGHAAGFDFLIDRKTSRYWDGMLSYSFIWARYKDPLPEGNGIITTTGDGTGGWYFPDFHRFHTLNFLLNLKPTNWMTFTTKLAFATGTPKRVSGEKTMYPAVITDGSGTDTVTERYTREMIYSDSERTYFSLPLDFKLSFHNYYKQSKVQWEFYVAVEDVLSSFLAKMAPEDSIQTDPYTGEDTNAPSADFSFIIPSFGMKLSY
ncbi:MAG: TonB-dependent receptor plug domain-containing protein [Spirochaetales bacterium]|nr:TonB-dependent receptor plug domain-containing protein [Spirochaetales bacterium]